MARLSASASREGAAATAGRDSKERPSLISTYPRQTVLALTAGARFGPYEILSGLGVGGMGEVYRARDTKLNRDVAIKVLPAAFASDLDRLARFTREAQTLASLNHPNIAHVYGLEESDGIRALVMELVQGADLSALIARGPMPLTDVLSVVWQIADALEAAHDLGIVHRDLKPANVKVRDDGAVKVLDFGLAKALDRVSASTPTSMNSPTLTDRATAAGVILGTPAYMSPEQARGNIVDKRTDIWAFGAVLYEMLSGQRLFKGDGISETLASVLKDTPSLAALPPGTPARLQRLLQRCLDRDVKERLRDIGEARVEIGRMQARAPEPAGLTPVPTTAPRSFAARMLPWTLTGFLGVALIAWLQWSPTWRSAPVPATRKLLVSIGADASLPRTLGASAILSPDGLTLAFVAEQSGQARLFVRKLDQLQPTALPGTENAGSPLFSPDGLWIAFFAGGELKKISVTGGAVIKLCDAPSSRGGTWTDDATIIFSGGAPNNTLMRVPASGGKPAVFGTLSVGAVTQRWPQALPGGRGLLYTEHSSASGGFDGANLVVTPLVGGTAKVVVHGGYAGRYLPTGRGSTKEAQRETGHLIYMQQGTLLAIRFDCDRLEPIGQAVPALDDVTANPNLGSSQLAFSSEGTLIYLSEALTGATPIDWMMRDGQTSVLRALKADWANPRFSPDGLKLALDISDGKQRDIFVYEWAQDTLTQLSFDPGQDRTPVWTPDGRRIVFSSDRAKPGTLNLYWTNADGTGEEARLTESPESQIAQSWHRSGRFLAYEANRGATGLDLMILPMERDALRRWTPGTPIEFLSTPGLERTPMFSPDGRWIAYFSAEAVGDIPDVYVRPFPGPGRQWRISTGGGFFPHWSATAQELLFQRQGKVMFAPYAVLGDAFRADKPQLWSPTSYIGFRFGNYSYDLHPDGKRLALDAARSEDNVVQDKVVFVSNFFGYLREITAARK